MAKRKGGHGHYCRICGCYKANEKFSGSGHASHICKACAKLPVEKRNEMQIVDRIYNLPSKLSPAQKKWLEEMMADKRERVRRAANQVYEERREWAENLRKEEEELEAYLAEREERYLPDLEEEAEMERESLTLNDFDIDLDALPF